jgi:uncharacterized damage-inducible protein DinB
LKNSENRSAYYQAIKTAFIANKSLAERAIDQISDHHLHQVPDDRSNSIAVIIKHISGNLISRWTDSLNSDGEKPDRHRDQEFLDDFESRDQIVQYWELAWQTLLDELGLISNEDPSRVIYIRGVAHTLAEALARSLGHTCYHVGQIVQLARSYAGPKWKSLSIPKGKSEQFNQENWGARGKSHS